MKKICFLLLCLLLTMNNISAQEQAATDSTEYMIDFYTSKFKAILQTICTNYDDSVDVAKLSDKCFNAMLTSLDPFSHYFNPVSWKGMLAESRGSSTGIGVELFKRNDTLVVVNIVKNSPAAGSDIKTGDKILFINGQSFIGKSVAEANEILKGETDTKVDLIVKQKEGSDLKALSIVRHEFALQSLATHFIFPNTKILYLKLLRFSAKSPEEIRTAIKSYKRKEFEAIILDLKDNQGGNLDAVIDICKDFSSLGDSILFTKARNAEYRYNYINDREGEFAKIPLAVIVNEKSASASEIVAGMAQDLDRGLVVGTNTIGKGLVQKSWNYTDTSAFRITVAKYFTPSGRLIQKPYNIDTNKILDPSLKLSLSPEAYEKLKQSVLRNGSTNVPIYYTRKGRIVIGNGGIWPDIECQSDTLTLLTEVLKSRGIILEFALDYIAQNREKISHDYRKFLQNFQISDEVFTQFTEFFRSKNYWNEEMLAKDKEIIRLTVKAVIGYLLMGDEAYYAVLSQLDSQISATINNIDKAKEFVK